MTLKSINVIKTLLAISLLETSTLMAQGVLENKAPSVVPTDIARALTTKDPSQVRIGNKLYRVERKYPNLPGPIVHSGIEERDIALVGVPQQMADGRIEVRYKSNKEHKMTLWPVPARQ